MPWKGLQKYLLLLAGFAFAAFSFVQSAQPTVVLLNVNDAIGPATESYIAQGIGIAEQMPGSLLVLELDTPGGLETAMRGIVSRIINAKVPVVTYVSPSGARAASAGTFILYASHIAAMAPSTNVGAATPISLIGEGDEEKKPSTAEVKAINDASAYIRSLAELRHRNVQWGEQAVKGGVSLSAQQALRLNVIDLIATDLNDLLTKLDGKRVSVLNKQVMLNTKQLSVITFTANWRTRFLTLITNPNIAYILLLAGFYGLLFEFLNPGLILPGVVGLISLFIALYAFQLLPINYVGFSLILIGLGFMVTEAFIPSFGALGIGGIISFMIGSIMLFDTHAPGFKLLLPVIVTVVLVTAGFIAVVTQLVLRAHRKPVVSGKEELLGSIGEVVIIPGDDHYPRARIRGELWQIRSDQSLSSGQRVRVISIDGLILKVESEDQANQQGESE
jgi:membrane-bound serine protease (ClpP class)